METRKGRGGHDNDREARGEEDRMIQATEKGKWLLPCSPAGRFYRRHYAIIIMIALSSQPPSLLRLLPIAATARLSAVRNPARLIVNNYPMQFARNFQIGAQPDRLFLPLQVSPSINSSCKKSRLLRGKRTFLCASLSAGKMELWSLFADESKKTGNYWKKKREKKCLRGIDARGICRRVGRVGRSRGKRRV